MVDDDTPKSAVELAMEKLRARDDFEEVVLSDAQKKKIADARSRTRAKIAELEIQQDGKLRQVASLEEAEVLRDEIKKEKARLEEELEKQVAKIRKKS